MRILRIRKQFISIWCYKYVNPNGFKLMHRLFTKSIFSDFNFSNMKKLIIVGVLMLVNTCFSFAQKSETMRKKMDKTLNFKAAYMGSIIYPGFKLGVEFPMYAKEKTHTKANGVTKIKLKERFIAANVSLYHHSTYHTNLMLSAEWQMRKTRQNGWFTEFAPGLGVSRTFLAGTTYEQNETGGLEKVNSAGHTYFLASVMGGFGYDFKVKKEKPIKAYFKGGLLILTPYSNFILPRPTVEIGVITSLSAFKKNT
jgi:hypothetical protein